MAFAWDDEDGLAPEPLPKREEVEQRLERWRTRVDGLFDQIEDWVPGGYGYRIGRSCRISLSEPLMEATGVAPVSMPTLVLSRPGSHGVSFTPDALWIIGTNGRIRVVTPRGILQIVDAGTDEAPQWMIYPRRDRSKRAPFNQAELLRILEEDHAGV